MKTIYKNRLKNAVFLRKSDNIKQQKRVKRLSDDGIFIYIIRCRMYFMEKRTEESFEVKTEEKAENKRR